MTDAATAPAVLSAAVLAACPDGVLAFDRELRVTAWNPALERLSGLPAAHALGRIVPDVFPFLREPARAALRGEDSVFPGREIVVPTLARRVWVEASCAPLRDESGVVMGGVAVVRGGTERRRAAEGAERMPADVLESMGDGFLAIDRAWRYTYVNAEVERSSGKPRAELLGRGMWEVYPEAVGTRAWRELHRAMDERVPVSFVDYYPQVDGWIEARAFPTPQGLAVHTRDVSEAHRAQAAVRESEERFRTLADTAPVLVWMADPDNRGTYFNRPWLEFTGRTLEEELGFGWLEAIHPDDRPRAAAYCGAHVTARQPFRMEFRMRRADGAYRWMLDHGVPRFDADGAFLGYVGSCVDITDRREAEEALRRGEQRYRSLVEASTQMVWSADARGMVEDLPRWRELTGQTVEQVRGAGWADALHPDDRARVVEAWWRANEAKSAYQAEYRVRMRDGSYRWFAARGVPVPEDGGGVREWIGVFDDVHDRKCAEAALRASEERFRLATRATRDVVWDWDLATDRVRFTEVIEEVLGFIPDEVAPTAQWWYDQIHPGDRDRVVGGIHEAIRTRAQQWTAEYRHRRADGTWAWVLDRAYLLCGDDGRPVRMIGATEDVTERRSAAAAAESERERLRSVLAQLPAAVVVYEGPELVCTALSDEARRMSGGRDYLGMRFAEAFPELAEQGFLAVIEGVYRTGEPFAAAGIPARWDADGDGACEEALVDLLYHALVDGAGDVYGVVAHVTDVTERERAARTLAEARMEAESRAAEADLLAHELGDTVGEVQRQAEAARVLAEDLALANEELLAASARADEARRRLEVLAEASARLAASLDYRETVRTVAALAAPALADWCFVEVREEGGPIRLLACGNEDPAKVELAFDVLRRFPIDPDAPAGTGAVLRTGEPEFYPDIPPEFAEMLAHDEEHLRILREIGFRSSISVPLSVAGRTFGVLSLVQAESGRRFTEADLPLARELAHRAAVAIENARLYGEALAANRAKAGFLATMSHELRTPLNAMIGYVDLLLLGIPEPIPAVARGQVERIRLASQHLLSIIEEILTFSRLEAGRETVELEEVDLDAVVGEAVAIIEPLAAGKGLAFSTPARAEPETMVTDPRKLRQILVNLLGNAVKFTQAGSVSFQVERVDGAVLLRVRDTGIGVDEAFHELIFEPFRQVDDAKTRSAAGTGLGLSVSRELARLLGGDITVESERGRGSTFTVRLPER